MLRRHPGSTAPRRWESAHHVRPLVIERLDDVALRPRRVAIGNFDGVHRGHAAIIAGCDTVLTFDPHPMAVLAPHRAPTMLTDLATKARLLAGIGVSELVVMCFDAVAAHQTAQAFVDEILVGRLGATHVSVGANFRFGARARGDAGSLRACQRFTTAAHPLVRVDGDVVSSTRIRAALAAGDVGQATRLLGRPHRLTGEVLAPGPARAPLPTPDLRVRLDTAVVAPPTGSYVCRVTRRGMGSEAVAATMRIEDRPGVAVLHAAAHVAAGEVVIELVRPASVREALGYPPLDVGGASPHRPRRAAVSAGAAGGRGACVARR